MFNPSLPAPTSSALLNAASTTASALTARALPGPRALRGAAPGKSRPASRVRNVRAEPTVERETLQYQTASVFQIWFLPHPTSHLHLPRVPGPPCAPVSRSTQQREMAAEQDRS